MKKNLLILLLFKPLFIYSQVNEITFNHQRINFSAAPRTAISPMSIKMWDNYQNGGPSTFGTVLEIYGYSNHQTGQLYFGGWDNSKIRYREAFYAQNTWSDWMTLLDSKNDVESSGILKINGTGNHYILNGNFGIGTSDPSVNLEVSGGGNSSSLKVRHLNEPHRDWGLLLSQKSDLSGILSCSGYDLRIESGWNKKLYLGNSEYDNYGGQVLIPGGKVGIGTDPGNYKLNVKGRIRADEIVVNTTGADFVFDPSYELRSLAELETFIRTNKHLPDISPAKEMQENGISAGEMQAKLLQKVEELTIYVIEQNKRIVKLEKQLSQL